MLLLSFGSESCCLAMSSLDLTLYQPGFNFEVIFLLLPLESWNYRHVLAKILSLLVTYVICDHAVLNKKCRADMAVFGASLLPHSSQRT